MVVPGHGKLKRGIWVDRAHFRHQWVQGGRSCRSLSCDIALCYVASLNVVAMGSHNFMEAVPCRQLCSHGGRAAGVDDRLHAIPSPTAV